MRNGTPRLVRVILIVSFAIAGAWQFGAGVYIHLKAQLAQQLISTAWSRSLQGERHVRPWPWADTWPIARLGIPSLDIDLYVLADASGRSLAFGPGVVVGSAVPGEAGNIIIAAHRDTHFRFMRHLPIGTQMTLQTADGKLYRYSVTDAQVLDVRRDYLDVNRPGSSLTLLTCYPFDVVVPGGPLRYAAMAAPVSNRE